jgi:hypothetical protein
LNRLSLVQQEDSVDKQLTLRSCRHRGAMASDLVDERRDGAFLLELLHFAGWQLELRQHQPPRIGARRGIINVEAGGTNLAEAVERLFTEAMRSA